VAGKLTKARYEINMGSLAYIASRFWQTVDPAQRIARLFFVDLLVPLLSLW